MDEVKLLIQDVRKKHKKLSIDEIKLCVTYWQKHRSIAARNKLFWSVAPLAIKRATEGLNKARLPKHELADLIAEAFDGVLAGLDKYDPAKGPLNAYILLWIRQRLINYVHRRTTVIKVPDKCWTLAKRLRENDTTLSTDECQRATKAGKAIYSQRYLAGKQEINDTTEEECEDQYCALEDQEQLAHDKLQFECAMELLDPIEYAVLRFISWGWPLRCIGKELGMSPESARQIRIRAIKRIKKLLRLKYA